MEKELLWIGIPHDNGMIGKWTNEYQCNIEEASINIRVERVLAEKLIRITSTHECDLVDVLLSVLRFENLFEGGFYLTTKIEIDDQEKNEICKVFLPFYKSDVQWMMFQNFTMNKNMEQLFTTWLEVDKKLGIIHNMFLYAAYAHDLTNDVKLALILQTFEPLSKDLQECGKLSIEPYNRKNVNDKRIIFGDRVYAIINKYGQDIFSEDDVQKVHSQAVELRDKVVHLDRSITTEMKGEQAGYYIQKFIWLYTILVMTEIGIPYEEIEKDIMQNVERYQNTFPDLYLGRS